MVVAFKALLERANTLAQGGAKLRESSVSEEQYYNCHNEKVSTT